MSPVLPKGRSSKAWMLILSMLIVIAVGGFYAKFFFADQIRGFELIKHFVIYLAGPLAIAMLILFGYLKTPVRSD